MEFNIVKLAFLLGYLAMLVCVVSGIPFLTALFRSVLVTVIFSLMGLFVRMFLMRIVGSVETRISADFPWLSASSTARAYTSVLPLPVTPATSLCGP